MTVYRLATGRGSTKGAAPGALTIRDYPSIEAATAARPEQSLLRLRPSGKFPLFAKC